MNVRVFEATPKRITLGDEVWEIQINASGCVDLIIAGGRVHECDLQKVAALLLEARRIAGDWFGKEWAG